MRGLRAETGMMEPQIEEWLEPPEAANGKEQSLPQSFWRVSSLPRPATLNLDFRPLGSVREYIYVF